MAEHVCLLRKKNDFYPDSFKRVKQGKHYAIIGKVIGEDKIMTQEYRYNEYEMSQDEAENHCAKNKGRFEPAKK